MKSNNLAISALLGLIGFSALPITVQAHGYMDYPPARQQICDIDGGYWDSTDGSTIPNVACRAAFIESSWTPFVQKPEFSTLVSNYNNQAAVEATITDGHLCSAGDKAKHGIDLPSADWQKTTIDLSNNGKITLQYRANTPHNPSFWKVYLSKPSYDSATMPLSWSDLDLIADFGNLQTATLGGVKYYQMEVTLPTDRVGNAVIYTRWQRQDPAGEGFYNCSDITFSENTNGGGTNSPLDKWVSSGSYISSTLDANVGDTIWFRIFDNNGNETVFEKFPITNEDEHVWGQDLATLINQKYPQIIKIGLKNNANETIEYQSNDLYSNLVYLLEPEYTQRLEIKTGNNAPVIDAPTQLNIESGQSLTFSISATDLDNDPLLFNIDRGTILSQSGNSIVVNYQAPETTTDSNDTITVSVGDPTSTSKVTINITITTPQSNGGETGSETTWDMDTAYNTGDTVLFEGLTYTAKWWTKGDSPKTSSVWEAQTVKGETEWLASLIYESGDIVSYQEISYQAQWWTKGEQPDLGGAWVQK
ncbi:spindolin [Vibrio sp. S17_S38]|uniref:lytic polysaccharide monooxygenase n=1 Tax=Vibrio sp. S17_S38 TaxID=2720229 RepID=UPI001680378D|nr:lytic polysaccharide monooxygenase [Vibrio sp. S17_S38]MBD1572459.1 spindolin [Vibrio sp. S17_S38]